MNIVEIKKLKKMYGEIVGIEDVSFNVKEGSIFGFIGPNGAGKSTTIRILMGLLNQDEGTFNLNLGVDSNKREEINKYIGYVPSEVYLYKNFKVSEFLSLNAKLKKYNEKENIFLAKYFELDINKKISELSHGNKKKVSIICALAHNPKLIILDEPTSGLDPIIQKKLKT